MKITGRPGPIRCLLIGAALGGVLLGGRSAAEGAPLHLFAPSLVYHCPPGHKVVTGWDKGTALAGSPGTLVYHGWTRWAGCSQSMTIDGGNR